MQEIFMTILKLGLAGSYSIIFVFIVRILLRKAPKLFSYVLWAIVLFRLVCPYSFTTEYSFVPEKVSYPEELELIERQVNEIAADENIKEMETSETIINDHINQQSIISENKETVNWIELFSTVWIIGGILLLGYSVISLIALKNKLKASEAIEKDIYVSKNINTPFVLGLFHPIIYIPEGLHGEEMRYILLHERVHIQRKTTLSNQLPLRYLHCIGSIHWYG